MLVRAPKEFERYAAEWAVKYAGAPKKDTGESSGAHLAKSKEQKQQKSKEEVERERIAQYVQSSVQLML